MAIHKVTFNIDHDYGYIALDETAKCTEVFFPDMAVAERIKNWLDREHAINTPNEGGGLSDFSVKRYVAARSLHDFHTVLTRAWESLGIHIDWSFPADYI